MVLWEAFETVVLPRRVARRFRFTVLVYRGLWHPWKFIASKMKGTKLRETFLSYFGPLSLLILFAVWAAAIIFGFALLFYSRSTADSTHPTFETCLYLSGTTMFTLGIGDVLPHTWAERFMVVFESGIGFGFLALILSFLPVIYQAFSRREVNIVLLDARAGSPPTACEMLLRRHAGSAYGPEALERASARLGACLRGHARESRVVPQRLLFPVAAYQRILARLAYRNSRLLQHADGLHRSLLRGRRSLTFAMCRHTVVDLAQLFGEATCPGNGPDRLPSAEYRRMYAAITQVRVSRFGTS